MSKLSFLSEDLAEGPVCSLITFQQLFFIYLRFLIQTWLMKKEEGGKKANDEQHAFNQETQNSATQEAVMG